MIGVRHAAWILLLVPACFHPSYDHPTCGPGGECPDGFTCSAQGICEGVGDSIDAAIREADAAPDGPGANAAPFCDPSDPHLVVCYEFEGDTRDRSNNHLDATMVNVSFPAGKVGQAMLFGATSAADVPDSALFDVTALTIEAWIWPSQLPSNGNRAGILDMNGQYAFFLHAGGELACTASVSMVTTVAHVATDRWTHVACTYDGAAGAIYVDGTLFASATGGGALNTGGNTGISLAADNPPGYGSRLIGLIDEVRLMNVARTAAQICADAGKATCL